MIAASVDGLDALGRRLGELPQTLAARLAQEVERLGAVLRDRVERNVAGAVLRPRSGRLAASIAVEVERNGAVIDATVSSDAPYAAIHEYGGTIPAREILPHSARVLAFPWRGQQRFFKRVQLPPVTIPKRSFMRSALDETEPAIRAAIERAAYEAIRA